MEATREPDLPRRRPRSRRLVGRILALAASLLVAAGLGLLWTRQPSPERAPAAEGTVLRQEPPTGEGEVALLAPAADASAEAGEVTFAWRPVAGARSYRVRVLDALGDVVASADTGGTRVVLDLDLTGPCFWSVTAEGPRGRAFVSPIRGLALYRAEPLPETPPGG